MRGSKRAAAAPDRGDLGLVAPEADGEAGEVRRAERRRLGRRGAHDGPLQHVGLDLHQQVVRDGAAVDAQLVHAHAGLALHQLDDVERLQRDRLQRRARDVRGRRAARDADDRAARVHVPVRRAEAGERGHDVDAVAGRHGRGERLAVRGGLDDAEAVAQPLHGGAGDEDAAFDGELLLAADARSRRSSAGRAARRRARSPVCWRMKQPVPYVFFALPASKQPCPKSAACWSPAMPAIGIARAEDRRVGLGDDAAAVDDATGSMAAGMFSSSSMKSSQSPSRRL